MKPTVEAGQWRESHGTAQPLELIVNQLRTAANRVFQKTSSLTTAGLGTSQVLWQDQDELPHDTHATLTAVVQASNDAGTVYGKWETTALFLRSPSGAAVQLGTSQDRHPAIVAGGLTIAVSLAGNLMQVAINDGGNIVAVNAWIEARVA